MAVSQGDGHFEPTAEAYPSGLDEYWTTMGPAQGQSPWAAPYYPEPAQWSPAGRHRPPAAPGPGGYRTTSGYGAENRSPQ